MDSYVAWNVFQAHLDYFQKPPRGGVGLPQAQETMAFRTLTTVGLFYFTMCEDPHE